MTPPSDTQTPARPTASARRGPVVPLGGDATAEPHSAAAPARDPVMLSAAVIAALLVLVSVSFRITGLEFWQDLAVGKAVWQQGPPQQHLWSWPSFGAAAVEPSWAYGALLWPIWSALGATGLFLLRWIATLAAFGFLWAAARRMGARGLVPLLVAVVASLLWRDRSQLQPDLVAAVLLGAQIWILETRRAGGPDRSWWLVPVQCAWANVQDAHALGWLVIAAYLVHDLAVRWLARPHGFSAPPVRNPRGLALVLLAAVLASFLTPYLWRGVAHPFQVALVAKSDPLFRTLADLQPLRWNDRWTAGFPLFLFGWPLLLAARWWRRGFDAAELVLCAAFTALVLQAQRFAGFYALVAFPFVARDLAAWVTGFRLPARLAGSAPRLAAFTALALAVGWLEWSRADRPLDVAIAMRQVPERAADYLGARPERGRGFNQHAFGGYLAHRFAPDRERLPFMDARQSGTANDRLRYARTFAHPDGWEMMNRTYRFDWALLDASPAPGDADGLRDRIDADTAWALVFLDDAGALYVKRSGAFAGLLPRQEYFAIPGGEARLALLGAATEQDSMMRGLARFELERQIQESPHSARAHSMLANLDIQQGDLVAARRRLEEALRQDPHTFAAHERLGMMELASNRPREALREFELERRLTGGTPELGPRLERARALSRQGR